MSPRRILAIGALALLTGGCGHMLGHTGDAPTTTSPTSTPSPVNTSTAATPAYSPPGGGFTVNPPVTPTISTSTIQTAAGPILQHMFTAEVDGNDVYIVDYADYPSYIKNASPDKVLEGACKGAAGNIGGTVDNEQTITTNGSPGRDFTVTSPKANVHARVYLSGVRLYQIIAVHTGGGKNDAQDASFLNSFQLTP